MRGAASNTRRGSAAASLSSPVEPRPCSNSFPDSPCMRSGVSYSAVMADGRLPRPLVNAPVQAALNENPFGCSPLVRQAIRSRLPALHRYSSEEADDLVALIASRGCVSADQVVVGDVLGALGMELSLTRGWRAELLHSMPGYARLEQSVRAAGGTGVAIPLGSRLENDLQA